MKYEKLDLVQGSDEWKKTRLEHITASNVPAIFGVSPYKTALEYANELLSKEEKQVPESQHFLFQKGHEVEQAAREWVQLNFKTDLTPSVVRSTEINYLLASLDGMDEKQGLIFEAKYVGRDTLDQIKSGKIKEHHRLQIQSQLLVTGFDQAIYFAMDPDGESVVVDIYREKSDQDLIQEKVQMFWDNLRMGRLPDPSELDIVHVADPQLSLLNSLYTKLSSVKKEYDALEAEVLARYAEHSRVEGSGVCITKFWSKGTIDWNQLAKAKHISQEEQERFRKAGSMKIRVSIK